MHSFEAGESGTVVLDVIAPPYDAEGGRARDNAAHVSIDASSSKGRTCVVFGVGAKGDSFWPFLLDIKNQALPRCTYLFELASESATAAAAAEERVTLAPCDPEPDFDCVGVEYRGLLPASEMHRWQPVS